MDPAFVYPYLTLSAHIELPEEETTTSNAMDHCSSAADSVVTRHDQLVHVRRVHPHPVDPGDNRGIGADHSGSQPSVST